MAYLTDNSVGLSRHVERSGSPKYFAVVLGWITLISVLTSLYHLSNVATFNAASNAACIALIAYAGYVVFQSSNNDGTNILFIAAAFGFTLLSIAFNGSKASITDAIKYLSIYVFYAAGYACASRLRPIETRYVCILAALPILFFATVGSSRVPDFVLANLGNTFSYFANTNIATLYYSALIFVLAERLGGRAILLQFVNVVLLNKIGAAVATVAAIASWIAVPLRKESLIALVVSAVVAIIAFWSGALDRVLAVLESMRVLVDLGPDYVSRMSFKRLVEVTGTTDLSGFFRVIHWANIWDIYSSSSLGTVLFGYGIGQTPYLTVLPFIPHNDYLRVLVEYGPINLAIFLCFLLHVLRGLETGAARVLFMVLLIYFSSENLLDHFASMTLYFTYAGRFSAMSPKHRPAEVVALSERARSRN